MDNFFLDAGKFMDKYLQYH